MLSCLQATSVGKFMKRNEGCVVGFIATQLVWRKELLTMSTLVVSLSLKW